MGFQVLLAATPQSFTRHAADSEEKPTEAAGPGPASPHQLPCSWDALAVDSWCFDHSWHALESSLSMVTGWEAWPALGSWSLSLVSSHDEFLTIQHMVQAPQDRYINRLRWLERSQNGETQLCSETGGVMLCSPVPRFPWAILGWSQGHEVLGWKQLHGVVHQLQAWWEGYGSGPNIPEKDSLSWSFWGRSAAWVPTHHLSELCGRMWLIAISILLLRHGTRTMVLPFCLSFLRRQSHMPLSMLILKKRNHISYHIILSFPYLISNVGELCWA